MKFGSKRVNLLNMAFPDFSTTMYKMIQYNEVKDRKEPILADDIKLNIYFFLHSNAKFSKKSKVNKHVA